MYPSNPTRIGLSVRCVVAADLVVDFSCAHFSHHGWPNNTAARDVVATHTPVNRACEKLNANCSGAGIAVAVGTGGTNTYLSSLPQPTNWQKKQRTQRRFRCSEWAVGECPSTR